MLVEKLFFENPDSKNLLYVLRCRVFDSVDFQLTISNLKQTLNSMFNIVYIDTLVLKERLYKNNDFKLIGPLKTFKSVFNTTLTEIINKNIQNNKTLEVFYFEQLKIIQNDMDFDSMLQEEYAVSSLFLDISNQSETQTNKEFEFYTNRQFDLESPDILTNIQQFGISFDQQELRYYKTLYQKQNRKPNIIELFDLCQSNSEHSRHWFFNGEYSIDNQIVDKSLFKVVKETLSPNSNSLVAFSDNSSVIKGGETSILKVDKSGDFFFNLEETNLVLTAETHNFPTLICPFEGASTGVGGRIRDNHSTGRGARIQQSLAGYCVGRESRIDRLFNTPYLPPLDMLVEASNGASDYGNKIGEPIVGGFTRSIGGVRLHGKFYEYLKPIMFSAGIGTISKTNLFKKSPEGGDLVIRLGGPVYKIGLGGGFNSSIDNKSRMTQSSKDAVQRGDPQMENKLNRVITRLCNLNEKNPITSIHDQGAGGLANVLKEIVYPNGAHIDLDKVTLGDRSLNPLEIWCSEFQESSVILINPKLDSIKLVLRICEEENVIADLVGTVYSNDNPSYGRAEVFFRGDKIVDFILEPILNPQIRKKYVLDRNIHEEIYSKSECNSKLKTHPQSINEITEDVFRKLGNLVLSDLDVCSKRFLTSKVDRSVSGLVAQQQCVGPLGIPLSNYSANMLSYNDVKGCCASIGERPLLGLFSEKLQAQYSLAEMITNISGAYINSLDKIKCSVNWMWPNKSIGESRKLFNVASELTKSMKQIGVGIDGGKDSLSMSVDVSDKLENLDVNEVVSPGNVVVTSYVYSEDLTKCITPDCKDTISILVYIPFISSNFSHSQQKTTLLGSILWKKLREAQRNNVDNDLEKKIIDDLLNDTALPTEIDFNYVKSVFELIQKFLGERKIQSLHDISDGGLFTTLFEMAYSGLKGISIFSTVQNWTQFVNLFFSEEPGVVVELSNDDWIEDIRASLIDMNIPYKLIGWTKKTLEVSFRIKISENDYVKKFNYPLSLFVESYEKLTSQIELKQCNKTQARLETQFIQSIFSKTLNVNSFFSNPVEWNIPNKVLNSLKLFQRHDSQQSLINQGDSKTILIVRDEGSNGDMEMGAFFKLGGFNVLNYNHNKLENDIEILNKVDGVVFVGGFTFSDMMESATCWATRIKNNHKLFESLKRFFVCKQKFVIGVCNGFQLLIKLGVFGDNVKLVKNDSGRFESRFSKITVDFGDVNRFNSEKKTSNPEDVFFKDMNFTSFGMWIAHGEGKLVFDIEDKKKKFIPILKYADCFLNIDECNEDNFDKDIYPQNPNGSTNNTAGIISLDGRILGLMPHFERSFLTLQCPYVPHEFSNQNLVYSPWFYISQNLKRFLSDE